MIGDNKEVEEALQKSTGYQLDEVGQAEWETFIAFDLFPVLKLALVK
jgi:nitrate reductase NapE component